MKSIIVASGISVNEKENGDVIDNFDYVIRFKGFENQDEDNVKCVGEKTDAVVFNTNIHTIKDMKSKLDSSFFENRFGDLDFYMTWTHMYSLRRGLKLLKTHMSNIKVINYEKVKKKIHMASRTVDDFHKNKDYSSGVIAATYFKDIENYTPLFVHGFDSIYYEENHEYDHYYKETQDNTLKRIHDLDNEALVIQKWVDENKLHRLK